MYPDILCILVFRLNTQQIFDKNPAVEVPVHELLKSCGFDAAQAVKVSKAVCEKGYDSPHTSQFTLERVSLSQCHTSQICSRTSLWIFHFSYFMNTNTSEITLAKLIKQKTLINDAFLHGTRQGKQKNVKQTPKQNHYELQGDHLSSGSGDAMLLMLMQQCFDVMYVCMYFISQ